MNISITKIISNQYIYYGVTLLILIAFAITLTIGLKKKIKYLDFFLKEIIQFIYIFAIAIILNIFKIKPSLNVTNFYYLLFY